MKYGYVKGIEKPISRLVQGTVPLNPADEAWSFALLDGIFEQGCNTFDTAHVYGNGDRERLLGKWIRERKIRDKVVILDKGAHHSGDRRRVTPFDIASDLHDSLARLKVDFIDLYILHRDDPNVPVGPIVETLHEYKEAGRIGAYGGSNWTYDRVRLANEYAAEHGITPFAASSPNYTLAEQMDEPWEDCLGIGGPPGEASREWYANSSVAIFAWSSLAAGFFSGRYDRAALEAWPKDHNDLFVRCFRSPDNLERLERVGRMAKQKGLTVPEVALAFVLTSPMDVYALVGCNTPEEFAVNVRALDVSLTPEERDYLDLKRDKP